MYGYCRPLKYLKPHKQIGFQYWLSLNAGQKYCKMLQVLQNAPSIAECLIHVNSIE